MDLSKTTVGHSRAADQIQNEDSIQECPEDNLRRPQIEKPFGK
jgi:hypothetical protein